MKITKSQLKQIIKEEVEALVEAPNFDTNTGRPLTPQGWKMAASNPKHPFYDEASKKTTTPPTQARGRAPSGVAPPRGQSALGGSVKNFDEETYKPLTAKGWELAAKNPEHPFHKAAQSRVGSGGRAMVASKEEEGQAWKNRKIVARDLRQGIGALDKAIKAAGNIDIRGKEDFKKQIQALDQLWWSSFGKGGQ